MIRPTTAGKIATSAAAAKSGRETYCCLHLGMPKTATTCMQQNLFPKHSQIEYMGKFAGSRNKFPTAAVQALNAQLFAKAWPNASRCRRLISELIAPPLAAGRIPFWSKEGMTAGGATKKKKQARVFRNILGECKVILFVREPLKFMESMYFQNLKGFQKPNRKRPGWERHIGRLPRYFTIEKWLDVMWSLPQKGAIGHLACAETAEIYADVFGREQVRVFLFEQLVQDPAAIVGQLCRFIGVDVEEGIELFQGKRSNERWTDVQIERLKRIEQSPWRSIIFRRGSKKIRTRMLGLDPAHNDGSAPKARAEIPVHWQQRIIEFARNENRRLAQQWGLPLEQYGYPL